MAALSLPALDLISKTLLLLLILNHVWLNKHILSRNSPSLSIGLKAVFKAFTVQLQALTDAPIASTSYFWSSSTLNLTDKATALSTSPTYPTLAVSYSSLEPGSSHDLVLVASTSVSNKREVQKIISSATFVVPTAPSGGSCTVIPSEGEALTTEFTLMCSSWGDSSSNTSGTCMVNSCFFLSINLIFFIALRYAFSYVLDGKEISLGDAQYSSSLQTIFPAPKTRNTIDIIAKIVGAAPFEAISAYKLSVSVQAPVY